MLAAADGAKELQGNTFLPEFFVFKGISTPRSSAKRVYLTISALVIKLSPVKVGLFTWNLVPDEDQGDKRFLCCYAGRTAQVKSDPRGWSLRWQCLNRIAPDDDWDGEIKWSTRFCEAAEAALRKAEEVLLIEWQVSL